MQQYYLDGSPSDSFYYNVHNGVVDLDGYTEAGITPAGLGALHLHFYSEDPENPDAVPTPPGYTPMVALAHDTTFIRSGVDKYRLKYCSNGPLPTSILLSEFGTRWQDMGGRKWAGGWTNFQYGLN